MPRPGTPRLAYHHLCGDRTRIKYYRASPWRLAKLDATGWHEHGFVGDAAVRARLLGEMRCTCLRNARHRMWSALFVRRGRGIHRRQGFSMIGRHLLVDVMGHGHGACGSRGRQHRVMISNTPRLRSSRPEIDGRSPMRAHFLEGTDPAPSTITSLDHIGINQLGQS